MITQEQLTTLRHEDERMNRDIAKDARKNGRQCVVDQAAFMHAVQTEGRAILGHEGREYWRDQKRLYPHLRGGRPLDGDSANGRKNRFGKVKLRWMKGVWHEWSGSGWVPAEPAQ
jgi:hypothetical protein